MVYSCVCRDSIKKREKKTRWAHLEEKSTRSTLVNPRKGPKLSIFGPTNKSYSIRGPQSCQGVQGPKLGLIGPTPRSADPVGSADPGVGPIRACFGEAVVEAVGTSVRA